MTRREVLTRILKEGERVFKNGASFTINNMLICNYSETAELSFDYDGDTGLISMIYVLTDGHVVLCMGVDFIERINVSDNWFMRPGIGNTVYGLVNGECFSCE